MNGYENGSVRGDFKGAGWKGFHATTTTSTFAFLFLVWMTLPGFCLVPETKPNPYPTFAMGTTVLPSVWIGSPNTDFTVAVERSDSTNSCITDIVLTSSSYEVVP